jgi:hypothetical protein
MDLQDFVCLYFVFVIMCVVCVCVCRLILVHPRLMPSQWSKQHLSTPSSLQRPPLKRQHRYARFGRLMRRYCCKNIVVVQLLIAQL